jgi:hypothetical protein
MPEVFLPTSECEKCGGHCCKQLPGCVFPEDCGDDVEAGLWELLQTGKYTFDYWEGKFDEDDADDYTAYFLRPRTIDEDGDDSIVNGTWGGRCVFHNNDKGCELEFEKRPLNCRMLKPRPRRGAKCDIEGDPKGDAIHAWKPYNEMIKRTIARWDAEHDSESAPVDGVEQFCNGLEHMMGRMFG